ncbi:UDP-N-acetylmuramyl peptide synthase [Bifidobacterium aemilianum]|nr:UDP-N-acetylmuramyl peptide synthase [Bifidobacterium aemilianum]
MVSEASSRRLTLGYLVSHYGFELAPGFASGVTITSLADRLESVRPGALYIPAGQVDLAQIEQAQAQGAYAALVPPAMRGHVGNPELPILFGQPSAQQMGAMAAEMAGSASDTLAIFAICGHDPDEVQANALRLSDFLHMLGNPVGLISAAGSSSLERKLELNYPLGILDIQGLMSVCAEDGASAVVVALDQQTLRPNSLQSVTIDVLGCQGRPVMYKRRELVSKTAAHYGFEADKDLSLTLRTDESDAMADQTTVVYDADSRGHLSLSIAMVLAAGVRKSSIKGALRVSRDLG